MWRLHKPGYKSLTKRENKSIQAKEVKSLKANFEKEKIIVLIRWPAIGTDYFC